jgi:RNA polymerase sigma factor (sigma-70 family)
MMVCRERTRRRAFGVVRDSTACPSGGSLENLVVDLSRTSEETMADRLDSRQILERLPPDDRHLLRLRFFEDASALEIGRQLGISEAAVRVRLFRVLAKLRIQTAADAEKQS